MIRIFPPSHPSPTAIKFSFSAVACQIVLLITALTLALWLVTQVHHLACFDAEPTNGAFQLFNPLRRLAAGQLPGRDFPVFHGAGTILLHYPIFLLFDGNFFGSEISRWFTTPLVFTLGTLFLLRSSSYSWTSAVTTSVTLLATVELFGMHETTSPGNALLGTRSATVLFVAGMWLQLNKESNKATFTRSLVMSTGLLCGVGLFVSTEQGFSLLAAVTGLLVLANPCGAIPYHRRFMQSLLNLVVAVPVFMSLISLTSGGACKQVLKFMFIEIPKEQFWYFGVPPNSFMHSIGDLLQDSVTFGRLVIGLCLVLIVILVGRIINRFGGTAAPLVASCLLLICQGLVGTIGYLGYTSPHYTEPLMRNCVLVALILLAALCRSFQLNRIKVAANTIGPGILAILATCGFVTIRQNLPVSVSPSPMSRLSFPNSATEDVPPTEFVRSLDGVRLNFAWTSTMSRIQSCIGGATSEATINLSQEFSSPVLPGANYLLIKASPQINLQGLLPGDWAKVEGGPWTRVASTGRDELALERPVNLSSGDLTGKKITFSLSSFKPKDLANTSLWSTYAGLTEYQLRRFHPQVDYIIHALGPAAQTEYVTKFTQLAPRFVLTINPNFSRYEPWIQNTSWKFYEALITDYHPIMSTPMYLLWERQPKMPQQGSAFESEENQIVEKSGTIVIQGKDRTEGTTLYSARVTYTAENPLAWLPLVGKAPRWFLSLAGADRSLPISLPPYSTQFEFPLFVAADKTSISPETISPFHTPVRLKISSLTLRKYTGPRERVSALHGDLPSNWDGCPSS